MRSAIGFLFKSMVLLVLLSGGSILWIWLSLPQVAVLKSSYPVLKYRGPEEPPFVSIQKARPARWVSLSQIAPNAVHAIMISEDWAYYQHHGYDVNQIREAFEEDWEKKSFARGASTITQQVARNVFLSKEKNLWRKAKEFYLAMELDETVGKNRVLEVYLNIAEWGPGIFGIGDASAYYFHKTPMELSAKEGAFLAMLLPSPVRYGQSFRSRRLTDYATETVQDILGKMVQANYLSDEEKTAEWNRPFSFEQVEPAMEPNGAFDHLKSGSE
jgi:monofunctional biosynthetic peptidoglycan transglycosylase